MRMFERAIGSVLVAAAVGLLEPAAHAQDYPFRAIRIIVPNPPGGASDITARVVAQKLSDDRSEVVRKTVVDYAGDKGLVLDKGQFRAKGLGLSRPLAIDPQSRVVDANRRVEFSIIKVPLKDLNTNEFDL